MLRLRATSATVIVALVLAACWVIAAPAARASAGSDEASMFALTNAARANVGLPALQWDPAAAVVATGWSQQMAAAQTLSHNPNLRVQIESQVEPNWTRIGENVGVGPNTGVLESLFEASPAHYANIVGDFNRVGIGAVRDARGSLWITLDFVKGPQIASVSPALYSPFTSPPALVAQQYYDLLGRQPDAGGMTYWSNLINTGMYGGSVAASFLTSDEFAGVVGPLVKLYYAVFNRAPDSSGLLYWLGAVQGGWSLTQVAASFMSTTEFQTLYAGKSLGQQVAIAYQNVLGRAPDPAGQAYWQNMIQSGALSFAGFIVQLTLSNELAQRLGATPQVTMVYIGMLRRAPDPSGLAYWVNQINAGQSVAWLTMAFFNTPEYASRF
jgi:hypothetical protein